MGRKQFSLIIIFTALLALWVAGCSLDHGLEPIRSGIQGTIKYIGKWPQNTAEVRIVAATKFPPTDINDLIIGDILPIGGDSTIYTFYLAPGDYYVGLVWRERNAAWGIQSIFGIYTEPGNAFAPASIHVPDDRTIVTGKDIIADFAYARKATNSSISGTIKFLGQWPAGSENCMVIATTKFPPATLLDLAFSGLQPANVDSLNYFIPASPGLYRAVGVVIKKVNQPWALENVVGLLLKDIVVATDSSQVTNVNFVVYF
ncbi:MAG: hypothetical protein ONB33_04715 [candidate division KSB1 bacterium]|nr:hypothetical protein [candidate division KSB1 bacterium]MDZ7356894.1 hypothetical protein [candidate division KSB1 bacterium]MDZ7399522.1 hypothetical protein [candidate division KSB1 bacterium]